MITAEELISRAAGIGPDGYPLEEQPPGRPALTLRRPDEILAQEFDDSDIILGDRLAAPGQSLVIAGQGGIGKSRLLLQLAACVASGRDFLGLPTGGRDLRWLIMQTENSNRRLQSDLGAVKMWLGEDWPRFADQVLIHTIENDFDGLVNLDLPENQAAIQGSIQDARAHIVAFDPLNDFSVGDLNKDADMKLTVQTLSRICRAGDPRRLIILLHHAITGRGGAAKATGLDRASFARNSKVLYAWARGQINIAPVDEENNNRIIIACGKCSNGKEFEPFAAKLNPETMLYEADRTVDVKRWAQDMAGGSDKTPLMLPDRVRELCKPLTKKVDLAKAIMEDCGCARGSAYRYITRTTQRGKLSFNKAEGTYSPK